MTVKVWHLGLAGLVALLAIAFLVARSDGVRNGGASASALRAQWQQRHDTAAAQANVRAVVPAMGHYKADHTSGYQGVTVTGLQQSYDAGIGNVRIIRANTTSYCIQNTSPSTVTYHKGGPAGYVAPGGC